LIIEKFSGSLINDKRGSGSVLNGQFSEFRFEHSVKRSDLLDVLEGMVEPPLKRFDGALMMPDVVRMIKTEKVGAEYGVEMGGSGVWKGNMV
jgi:hypothetical protein